jgi:predicted amidohydrolase YtcJ
MDQEKQKPRQENAWTNSMRIVFFLFVCIGLLACRPADEAADATSSVASEEESARWLVHNAHIYTLDAGNTVIESGALAISSGGEILALGDNEPMLKIFPEAQRVDLQGKSLLPGLIDAHGHLYGLALSYTRADLVGTQDKSDVMSRLREFAADLPPGEWLLGRGWDQNDWPEQEFPSRQDLDAEFPDRPVWLRRIDGHAAWGNSAALAQTDRDLSGDWQPEGGYIHRDGVGEATGIFIDGAIPLVESLVPQTSLEVMDAALDLATQTLVSLGLTGVHDPGIDLGVLEHYRKKIAEGKFPLRVYAMADGMGETLDWLCENGRLEDPSGRLVMRSVKLYGDGALGSRGAALLSDYSDEAGQTGLLFSSQEDVEDHYRRVLSCGLQIGIHAIGDAANRQALDAYARVAGEFPDNPGRHRVEHAQVIHADDISRFSEMEIIAAMQPIHATSDMYWAGERLGADRASGAYAWRSLLDSGAVLAFGSDFPVEKVNPMLGIYAAITRQDLEGWPADGWYANERLSREETLRAFTLDAAFAAFMESEVGSIEVGKRADFVVLDQDIMQIPPERIPHTRVLQTWLDGEVVFKRN